MSESRRRTRSVFEEFQALTGDGQGIRPGAVAAHLREQGAPMGAWEIRGEFSRLLDMQLIRLNAEEGAYYRVDGAEWPDDQLSQAG